MYFGIGAGLYYSIKLFKLNTNDFPTEDINLYVLAWAILMLIYILKFFSPRRIYNKVSG